MSSKKSLLFLLKFLPIFFGASFVIFSQSISAKEDLKIEERYPYETEEEDRKSREENKKNLFTKKDLRYWSFNDFEQHEKSESTKLIELQKSTTLKKQGDCRKDKVSELIAIKIGEKGNELLMNFIVKYQSGISGFYGAFSGGMIMQKEYFPRGLKGIKINDDVELCLIDKPDYCPINDERGKIYHATNLRTGGKWVLRGSIKGCGEDFSKVKSINCDKAQKTDEKIICSNSELKFLDQMLADEYQNFLSVKKINFAKKSLKEAKDGQLLWLKERSLCDTFGCIKNLYQKRLDFFDQFLFTSKELKFLGTCAKEKISRIGTRFSDYKTNDNKNEGTSVSYDSAMGISYGDVPELFDSKIGDKVILCIVKLASNCPAYDHRGITYTAYNPRTKKSWTLPDSQHYCGGA